MEEAVQDQQSWPKELRGMDEGGMPKEQTVIAWNPFLARWGYSALIGQLRDWWRVWSKWKPQDPTLKELQAAAAVESRTRLSTGTRRKLSELFPREVGEWLTPSLASQWLNIYGADAQVPPTQRKEEEVCRGDGSCVCIRQCMCVLYRCVGLRVRAGCS